MSSRAPPGKSLVYQNTSCPRSTRASICASETLSAPPEIGFFGSRQLSIRKRITKESKPRDFFQHRRGGLARDERQDPDFSPRLLHRAAFFLVQFFQRIVAPLHVNVRRGDGKESGG